MTTDTIAPVSGSKGVDTLYDQYSKNFDQGIKSGVNINYDRMHDIIQMMITLYSRALTSLFETFRRELKVDRLSLNAKIEDTYNRKGKIICTCLAAIVSFGAAFAGLSPATGTRIFTQPMTDILSKAAQPVSTGAQSFESIGSCLEQAVIGERTGYDHKLKIVDGEDETMKNSLQQSQGKVQEGIRHGQEIKQSVTQHKSDMLKT